MAPDHTERQLRAVLASTSTTTGLSESAIEQIVDSATIARFRAGRTIARANKAAGLAKIVLSGTVRLMFQGLRAEPMIVRFVKPGTGLNSIHEPGRPAFSAVAHTEAGIALVPHERFSEIIAELPAAAAGQFSQHSWETMSDLLRDKCELLTRGVSERLEHEMAVLARDFGRRHPRGTLIDLAMTQQQLAQLIVVERSTLNRGLRTLEEQGKISRINGRYLICKQDDAERSPPTSTHLPTSDN